MVETIERSPCPSCGYGNEPEELSCALCGELLRTPDSRETVLPVEYTRAPVVTENRRIGGLPEWAFYLLVGAPVALLFSRFSLRILSYIGWFLGALTHEMGHTASALFFGSFAYPAIRLDGHAAAFHQEPSLFAAACIWGALVWLAWHFRASRGWLILFASAALLYPVFALTDLKEYLHLAAGHLGELVFATIFFWRAMRGGFTANAAERPLYSALAWLWMGGNVLLFGSLVLSAESRMWYLTHGSFGLENDFVRIARMLSTSLPTVALPMLVMSFLPLPVAAWLSRRGASAAGSRW